ncbi:MAG: hypothetical protein Kow0069_22300 [Promethearchaeota archaeon]
MSTRLEEREVEKLDEIARVEKIDRSALVRKFVLEQVKVYEMKRASEFYRKGLMSLQEAATVAGVSVYEMMDYLQKEKVRPPLQSAAEIKEEIDELDGIGP